MGSKRIKLNSEIEAEILKNCRRRCCICYGLNRDTEIKNGQIAHLDQDPNNNNVENLAYLCFFHHDQYDSTTRQSKNLTITEVKKYREELISHITIAWKEPVTFGKVVFSSKNDVSGHYVNEGANSNSEFDIKLLTEDVVQVRGFALWGTKNPSPHLGELDFVGTLIENEVKFVDSFCDNAYEIILRFEENKLIANERYINGFFAHFGAGVSFEGEYQRRI